MDEELVRKEIAGMELSLKNYKKVLTLNDKDTTTESMTKDLNEADAKALQAENESLKEQNATLTKSIGVLTQSIGVLTAQISDSEPTGKSSDETPEEKGGEEKQISDPKQMSEIWQKRFDERQKEDN